MLRQEEFTGDVALYRRVILAASPEGNVFFFVALLVGVDVTIGINQLLATTLTSGKLGKLCLYDPKKLSRISYHDRFFLTVPSC